MVSHRCEDGGRLRVLMAGRRYDNALFATLTALRDRLVPERPVEWDDRLDGQTALVTGANRGLGRAIAVEHARARPRRGSRCSSA